MAAYYVSKIQQSNGDHEVHKEGCSCMPQEDDVIHLGEFSLCMGAMRKARREYSQVNGCSECSRDCRTG